MLHCTEHEHSLVYIICLLAYFAAALHVQLAQVEGFSRVQVSILVLEPTQPPLQSVLGSFLGGEVAGLRLTAHLYPVSRFRSSEGTCSVPHVLSQYALGQLHSWMAGGGGVHPRWLNPRDKMNISN
jgi:hypothetical protein